MPYSVFVSYSTRDLMIAQAIAWRVRQAGAQAYVAEYTLDPGLSIAQEILTAIKNCDLFLLLWSTSARESDWVPQEIGAARGLGKSIMPLVCHDGLTLPAFISDLKYLKIYENPQAAAIWLHKHVVQQVSKKNTEAWITIGAVGAILLALSSGSGSG